MSKLLKRTIVLAVSMAAGAWGTSIHAADIESPAALPAVSALNGKIELGAGWAEIDEFGEDELFRGGASLSLPVGDMFGLQADVGVVDVFGETAAGGNLHAFTRDPESHLLGAFGGFADVGNGDIWFAGPEAELYLENFSVEMVAGYMKVDLDGESASDEFFAVGDIGFYATENLRLTAGARSVAGFESGRLAMEWLMTGAVGMPASFTLEGRAGEDGLASISAGFSLYFGPEEKSLIRRHREDDPPNYYLDIYGAAGAFLETGPVCPPPRATAQSAAFPCEK